MNQANLYAARACRGPAVSNFVHLLGARSRVYTFLRFCALHYACANAPLMDDVFLVLEASVSCNAKLNTCPPSNVISPAADTRCNGQ